MGEKMRLDKYLSNMGKGSRSELRVIMKRGVVTVNGKTVKDGSIKVDLAKDNVAFEGVSVPYIPYIYLMLNKPQGVISATEDAKLPVVVDLVPEPFRHYEVFPVGRLDIDTEGLLLLTNDGALAHRLLSPKHHVPKQYFAKLAAPVNPEDTGAFEKGITLEDGYECMPAKLLTTGIADEVLLTIYEGKFHQVKRMFEALGNKVIYLKRMRMGGLQLDESLKLGEMRLLTAEELELIENSEGQ
ncbi:rRNA pseudouridine synthase [Fusibacter paucivorans]|uniref:Pseudouridine synthase n=1 Tax=Fusibacter paucivorans TaxID=76009 RepID=A0ABS5PLN9_9FIRM|nr:pseudouridine synthase [Fusibacter paucivorans]MBS7525511.1 rRNA pseudouridine synthase [Fusibacter paucivorans]